jgi:hypothetical protein
MMLNCLCKHIIHNHDTAELHTLLLLRRIFEKCHPNLWEILHLNPHSSVIILAVIQQLKAREHHHQHECTDCQMSDFQKQGSAG